MSATERGRWLSFHDYLTGVNRSRTTLHAVPFHDVAQQGKRATVRAVCDRRVYPAGQAVVDSARASLGHRVLPWPPYHRSEGMDRCRDCWVTTGKPRPDSAWTPEGQVLVRVEANA